jgi:hypothetical protein
MRFFLSFLLCFMVFSVFAQPVKRKPQPKIKFPETKEIKIDSVVLSRFYPGVYGAPIVYNVLIYCKTKVNCGSKVKSDFLRVDSLWMDEKVGSAGLVLNKSSNPLRKGQSFRIMSRIEFPTNKDMPNVEFQVNASVNPPIKHNGRAVFRYFIGGKKVYVVIPDVILGTTVYAP